MNHPLQMWFDIDIPYTVYPIRRLLTVGNAIYEKLNHTQIKTKQLQGNLQKQIYKWQLIGNRYLHTSLIWISNMNTAYEYN